MNNWFEALKTADIPVHWEETLQRGFPSYRFLSESDRRELRRCVLWFTETKRFEGCDGLVITDEIRVLIAAQACMLLLHRETPCYERLRLVCVYPGSSYARSSIERVSGESWQVGVVALAWDAVRGGAANPFDGDNVVLHEFAHQLDDEDGETDGTPLLGRGKTAAEQAGIYAAWARMLSTEYDDLRHHIEKGRKTVMDSYGGTNHAEFFAVATECFFEKPRQLRKKHPNLYAELRRFYRQDPADWACEPSGSLNGAPANRRPAGKSDGSDDLSAPLADDRAVPAGITGIDR
jgi:hypothetical protein